MEEGAGSAAAGPAAAPSQAAPPARPAHVHTHTHGTSPTHRGSAGLADSPQCRLRSPAMLAAAASPRLSLCRSRRHVTPTRERGRGRGGGASRRHAPARHRLTPRVPPPPPGPARLHAPEFPTPVTERRAPRGWPERHAGSSGAAVGWAGGPAGGGRTGFLCSATCPWTGAQSAKLKTVYCAATTCKTLGNLGEQASSRSPGWAGGRKAGPEDGLTRGQQPTYEATVLGGTC